jgi:hypothetical protein
MNTKHTVFIPFFLFSFGFFIFPIANVHAINSEINRAMYIWSRAETTYGAEYIKNYLIENNITTAIASSSNKKVFKQLLATLPQEGIRVELLVGSNSLLTNPDPIAYFDNLLQDIDTTRLSAVHLDVEPHATSSFPDYHSRESYYQNLYIKLLKTSRTYFDERDIKLTVSIPVFYPKTTVRKIYRQADSVYIMAYQITSMNYLEKRLKEEFAQGKNKTIVAFRANDFENRSDFETYLEKAASKLNTNSFALHDFGRFVTLDTQ